MDTTYLQLPATQPNHHHSALKRRAAFARQAAIAAFGSKAIHALDKPNVEVCQPDHGPRPRGKVATTITRDTGLQAIRHWLAQAAKAESDEERETVLEIAGEIARLMGLEVNLIGQEVA